VGVERLHRSAHVVCEGVCGGMGGNIREFTDSCGQKGGNGKDAEGNVSVKVCKAVK
jgi:hypothetical protein